MSDNWDVGQFHRKFDLPSINFGGAGPREVPDELMAFRIKFLHEEVQEFEDAFAAGDEAGMFDALLDLVYVAHGTAHIKGYPWAQGWDAVQSANLRKVRAQPDGSDSKRGSEYDVVKPEGWLEPDIVAILKEWGWNLD